MSNIPASPDRIEWSAIIGPPPDGSRSCHQALVAQAKVGPLFLEPSEVTLLEAVPIETPPQLNGGWQERWTYPIRVRGDAVNEGWPPPGLNPQAFDPERRGQLTASESASAATELHRLRGLLALAWDSHWTIRGMPWNATLTVPERIGPPIPDNWPRSSGDREKDPVELPEWTDRAWSRLDDEPALRQALAAHLEGVAIHPRHPSFALIAYVAAIEAVGQKLRPPETCPACKQVKGSTSRFTQALRRVMSGREARKLNIYAVRSKTAHEGLLLGDEGLLGAISDFASTEGSAWEFGYKTVGRIRKASRELLLQYLVD
jgi:hypothetical protein